MDEQTPEPKISLPEAIFVGLCFVLLEFLDPIVILGPLLNFALTQLYVRLRNLDGTPLLIVNIVELFPVIDWFPWRTIGFILIVIADRNPEFKKSLDEKLGRLQKVVSVVKGGKGGAPANVAKSQGAPDTTASRVSAGEGGSPRGEETTVARSEGAKPEVPAGALGEPKDVFKQMEEENRVSNAA